MKASCSMVGLFSLAFLMLGCSSNKRIDELETKVAATTARLDSLLTWIETIKSERDSPYSDYVWFDLGKTYHQLVDRRFYVSNIKTTYKENGFEVSGLIANLDALLKTNVKVQCAIKDTSAAELLTYGFSEMSYLPPGTKLSFTVFVPTQQSKVAQVGIRIPDYRM